WGPTVSTRPGFTCSVGPGWFWPSILMTPASRPPTRLPASSVSQPLWTYSTYLRSTETSMTGGRQTLLVCAKRCWSSDDRPTDSPDSNPDCCRRLVLLLSGGL